MIYECRHKPKETPDAKPKGGTPDASQELRHLKFNQEQALCYVAGQIDLPEHAVAHCASSPTHSPEWFYCIQDFAHQHYMNHGRDEGRQWGCPEGRRPADCYLDNNSDVPSNVPDVTDDDQRRWAAGHYIYFGHGEGRTWGCASTVDDRS